MDVDYNKTDVIGQGAFGTVYRVTWLGTLVTLKEIIIKKKKCLSICEEELQREIALNSMLRHILVVQFMANAVADSTIY